MSSSPEPRPGLRSMTGFATLEERFAGGTLRIEVRSVNHRHLDVQLQLRQIDRSVEQGVRRCCREVLGRGRVEFQITWVAGSEVGTRRVDADIALGLLEELRDLERRADQLGRHDEEGSSSPLTSAPALSLRDVLRLPGVVQAESSALVVEGDLEAGFHGAVRQVLVALDERRREEGERLRQVLERDLELLDRSVTGLEARGAAAAEALRQRLYQRLETVLDEWRPRGASDLHPSSGAAPVEFGPADDGLRARIVQEAAVLAERQDTTEEIDRLRSHLVQFRTLLDGGPEVGSEDPVDSGDRTSSAEELSTGKQLEFLLQEILRELNTVASKCRDAEMAQVVATSKAVNERLREQVLNLE